MVSSRVIWDKWEDIAVRYLEDKGIKILKRNFSSRNWEIDIIWEESWILIFFEVKFRTWNKFWLPEEYLTKNKKASLMRAILFYCHKNWVNIENCRMDFLAIIQNKEGLNIKHYKNIALD